MKLQSAENRRENNRHPVMGITSNTTNGLASFIGVIDDVSTCGLRLSDVPQDFNETLETCYTIVSTSERYYSFALQPRWVRKANNGMSRIIGFEIENPPASWHRFIESIAEESSSRETYS